MNLKKIKDINELAMIEVSVALSKLMRGPVKIGTPVLDIKRANEWASILPSEEKVVGLSSHLTGNTEGDALLILPSDTALALCDLLLKRDRGATQTIAEVEMAVLEEVANIIIGNYLRAFSLGLGLKSILHCTADLCQDKFATLISQITPNANESDHKDEAVFIEILFSFQQATVKGYLMLLLQTANLDEALGGPQP